ncbi:glycosyltransferase family 2 protein [Roseateles violae]|uniref:Glycosyltransferase n=1 Tax=Roseateles violae TaxID=3058042 RepID=A0ABT8DQ45_9BURK|nr:glycosyltransferase [Pelomonas sp. PFR6]MDN3920470.1 glycosyltransferase [Pelomonas sp. PFR6]
MSALHRVSVVIPCFNAEPYIAATLRSVLGQTGAELEVIVVDDGSTDDSVARIEREFPQVRLIRRANAGVAAARNAGIAAATGDWVAFCDADDIWLPGKLSAQFEAIAASQGCRMSYTAWYVWTSAEPQPDPALLQHLAAESGQAAKWTGATGWLYPELLLDCVVWTSTVLVQRSLLDETGVFDTELRIGEDYDLWLRTSRVTSIERVSRPLALYRQHPASITRSMPSDNYRGRVVQRALDVWGLAGPDGRQADAAAVRNGLAGSWSEFAYAQLEAGQRHAARRSAREALRVRPGHWLGWKLLLRSWLPDARRSS